MKLINQTEGSDCGPACLSMLTGIPMEDVKKEIEFKSVEGTTFKTMYQFLAKYGWACGATLRIDRKMSLDEYTHFKVDIPIEDVALLTVKKTETLHFVVWDGSKVLDPWMTRPTKLEDYKIVEWCFISSLASHLPKGFSEKELRS